MTNGGGQHEPKVAENQQSNDDHKPKNVHQAVLKRINLDTPHAMFAWGPVFWQLSMMCPKINLKYRVQRSWIPFSSTIQAP